MSLLESVAIAKVDKAAAQDALREYRKHRDSATPEDLAIMRAYEQIARGRVVVSAYESVRHAGRFPSGLPKLALIRADVRDCHCQARDTSVEFSEASPNRRWGTKRAILAIDRLPQGEYANGVATVPLIPLPQRPKASLENYHILWEADWKEVPRDPLLLRKLKGDLWLVLAAWDLTEVERAVLAQRSH